MGPGTNREVSECYRDRGSCRGRWIGAITFNGDESVFVIFDNNDGVAIKLELSGGRFKGIKWGKCCVGQVGHVALF
jgi:hypothetical protein